MDKPTLTGTIYFASDKAMRDRLYREGQRVTIASYRSARYLSDSFVQIELDDSGTSYVHLTLT